MLRETKSLKEADLIIYQEALYTPEEFAEGFGLRFLVDEPEEEETEPEEAERPARKRLSSEEVEILIREAQEAGADTMTKLQKATGLSYARIKKFLETGC